MNVKRILLPTDFSDCARTAFEYACDLTSRYGAELTLLHVVHDVSLECPDFGMGLSFPGYLENLPQRRKKIETAAKSSLEQLANEFPDCTGAVDCHVKFGSPITEILDYIESHEIDLIVMGTHGRAGLSHTILGSVAERVVRHADCPVMTIRRRHSSKTTTEDKARTDAKLQSKDSSND